MKKFLAALTMIACVGASAEVIATSPTKAGGEIRLTNDMCQDTKYGRFYGYIRTTENEVHMGCWSFMDGDILVKFANGIVRMYDISGFKLTPKFAAQVKKESM